MKHTFHTDQEQRLLRFAGETSESTKKTEKPGEGPVSVTGEEYKKLVSQTRDLQERLEKFSGNRDLEDQALRRATDPRGRRRSDRAVQEMGGAILRS